MLLNIERVSCVVLLVVLIACVLYVYMAYRVCVVSGYAISVTVATVCPWVADCVLSEYYKNTVVVLTRLQNEVTVYSCTFLVLHYTHLSLHTQWPMTQHGCYVYPDQGMMCVDLVGFRIQLERGMRW